MKNLLMAIILLSSSGVFADTYDCTFNTHNGYVAPTNPGEEFRLLEEIVVENVTITIGEINREIDIDGQKSVNFRFVDGATTIDDTNPEGLYKNHNLLSIDFNLSLEQKRVASISTVIDKGASMIQSQSRSGDRFINIFCKLL